MVNSVLKNPHRSNRFAWIFVPILLLAIVAVSGFALRQTLAAHAAPAPSSPLNGRYALKAVTTAGVQTGLYITGEMEIVLSGTSLKGTICGLSYAPSECTLVTGKTTDSVHVALTLHAILKMPVINLAGAFQTSTGAPGSFTGFKGTFNFGKGPKASSGTWEAISVTVPSATGTWNVYLLIKTGNNTGKSYNGVMTLSEAADGTVTGTYCPTNASCLQVKGYNLLGFVHLDLGGPATFVIKGTFTTPDKGFHGRMDGQFYMPGTGTGAANSRGYWVAND